MSLVRLKPNIGRTDMVVRIILGGILFALGALRALPGRLAVSTVAVLFGATLIIEGTLRY